MDSVAVVGAGPIGLKVASLLAKHGWEVNVLEEHSQIGIPENCSGLISLSGIKELGMDVKDVTVNKIYGAEIVSPSGEKLVVERKEAVAVVIDRAAFDRMLYKEALKSGASIEFNSKFIDLRTQSLFLKKENRGELRKVKIVVGADGVYSKVREVAGINISKKYFVHSYQERVEGSFNKKKVYVYLGSFARNFFAWIIPENDHIARAGIATSFGENPSKAFERFKEKFAFEFDTIEKQSFAIPIGPPIKDPVVDKILLVGDAAFHVKATTGGGIIMGLSAAEKCAKAIEEHFKYGTELKNYSKLLKPIIKELVLHWKIRRYLNSLDDSRLDKLLIRLKKAGIEEFLVEHGDMDKPSRFLGKLLKKPKFWRFLPLFLRLSIK